MAESLNERYSRLMRGPACAGKSSRHTFNTRMRRLGYSDSEISTASVLREQGNLDVMDSRLLCQPLVDWVEKFWDFDNLDILDGKDFSVMHRPTKVLGVDKPSVDLLEHLRGDGSDSQRGRARDASPSGGAELAEGRGLDVYVQGDDVVVSTVRGGERGLAFNPLVAHPNDRHVVAELGKMEKHGFRVAQPPELTGSGVGERKEETNRYECLPSRIGVIEFARLGNPLAAGVKDKSFLYDYLIALSERDFVGTPECGVTHPQAGQLGQTLINMIKDGFYNFEGELLLTLARSDVLASKR